MTCAFMLGKCCQSLIYFISQFEHDIQDDLLIMSLRYLNPLFADLYQISLKVQKLEEKNGLQTSLKIKDGSSGHGQH